MTDPANPSHSDSSPTDPTAEDSTTLPHAAAIPAAAGSRKVIPRVPQRFGRYEIVRTLGSGGMGAVYLARDTVLDRQVALKVPHFGPKDRLASIERFRREARTAAALSHPNLCPVFDVGQADGVDFLTMLYVPGESLAQRLRRDGSFPVSEALDTVQQIARALEVAHRAGIIHRDLKPANILMNERGEAVVTDFGLSRRHATDARLTDSGSLVGTPAYMPPEQIAGDGALGPPADIYSLGVILYALLSGRLPFEGETSELFDKILQQAPVPPSQHRKRIDPRLDAVCLKAIAKNPADRFRSMADFADALEEISGTVTAPARRPDSTSAFIIPPIPTPTTAPRPAPTAIPRKRRVLIPVLIAALLAGSAGLGLWSRMGTVQERDPIAAGSVWEGRFEFLLAAGEGAAVLKITERSAETFVGEYESEGKFRWEVHGRAARGKILWELSRALNEAAKTTGATGRATISGTYSPERISVLYADHDSKARIELSPRK